MTDKIEIAVKQAKEQINKHPQDPAHDLAHHERVWKNCKMIEEKEGINVEMGLLKVACFWHDVSLKGGWSKDNVRTTSEYLLKYLPDRGFSKRETDKIVSTVRHHEFLDTPKTVECMVLQDADKIDVPSLDRITLTYNMYLEGKMNEEDIKKYFTTGLKWLPILPSTMYFVTSREFVEEKINEIVSSPQLEKISSEMGLVDESLEVLESFSSEKVKEENKKHLARVEKIKNKLLK